MEQVLAADEGLTEVDRLLLNAVLLELFVLAPSPSQRLEEDPVSHVAGAAIAADEEPFADLPGASRTGTAEALLEAILADGGWYESAEVKRLLGAAGYPERTAQRAAKGRVEAVRHGFPATTLWRLADAPQAGATVATVANGATGGGANGGATADVAQPCPSCAALVAPTVAPNGRRRRFRRLPGWLGTHRVRAAGTSGDGKQS